MYNIRKQQWQQCWIPWIFQIKCQGYQEVVWNQSNHAVLEAQSGGTIALDASYKKLYTYFTSVVEFGEFSLRIFWEWLRLGSPAASRRSWHWVPFACDLESKTWEFGLFFWMTNCCCWAWWHKPPLKHAMLWWSLSTLVWVAMWLCQGTFCLWRSHCHHHWRAMKQQQ